eukprot:97328_1
METLVHNASDNTSMDEIDQNILCKMNQKYGSKYNKRIISNMQQHDTRDTPQLISSIPPQVLSYSFQYLSFTELCRIEATSSYFAYLHHKYQNLSHYFICLDAKFWHKSLRNQVNLNKLSQFKHIKVTSCYRGGSDVARYKATLYMHIVEYIITKSILCLDTLQIDIPSGYAVGGVYYYRHFTLLNHILGTFNSLPISRLIWNKDTANPQSGELTQHIILPIIHQYAQLQSVDLFCPSWNVFEPTHRVIASIATHLKNIQTLSIVTGYDPFPPFLIPPFLDRYPNKNTCNTSLKELKVEFVLKEYDDQSMSPILSQLFSTFIGITHFQFGFAFECSHWVWHRNPAPSFNIDWEQLFDSLCAKKRTHSINHPRVPVPALRSLQFDVPFNEAKKILQDLSGARLRNEPFIDLKHFGINVVSGRNSYVFDEFVDCFIPFAATYLNIIGLTSLDVSCGDGYKIYFGEWQSFPHCRARITIEPFYCRSILRLLSNLPRSLSTFKLKTPILYRPARNVEQTEWEIWNTESMKLVHKLCEMLSERTDSNLKSIVLDNILRFPPKKAKEYLMFMFGFNNKFYFNGNRCCLAFT